MALKVGELFASFGIKTDGLDSAISGIEKKCQGIANSLSGFGKAASVAITAPLTLAAKQIYEAGTAFDAEMSKVAAISGATGQEFDALRAAAIEMGSTTSFSASQSAEALEYMAMAGWKTEQMLDGLPGIMDLAAASGEDLGTVSDIVTDALTAFGLKAEDAGHFADVLAAASSNANTNVSMMGETFKYAAPIAGAFGYTVEDTALAIGLMANSGIKSSQAGTSLRRIMTSLNGEVKITGKEIGNVVIQTTNADGSMRGFNDILMDCRDAFAGLTEAERAEAAEALVGKNAMSGFLAIMNATDEDVEKLTQAITDCDGATQRMADTMLDNAQGDIVLFKSAIEGLEITLWDMLEGPFRSVVQQATSWVDSFRKMDKYTQKMTLKTAAFSAALGPAALGLSKIIKYAPKVIKLMAALVSPVGLVTAALGLFAITAADSMNGANAGFGGVAESIAKFSQQAMYAIQNLNQKIPEAMRKVSQTFPIVANFLETAIKNLVPNIVDTASLILSGFMNFISDNASRIAELGRSVVTNLVGGISRNLPELIPAAANVVASIISALVEGIPDLIQAGIDLAKGIWDGLKNVKWAELGAQLLSAIGTAISQGWSTLSSALSGLGEKLKTTDWSAVGSQLWETVKTGFTAVSDWAKMLILGDDYTPDSTWSQAGRKIWEAVKGAFGTAADIAKQLVLGQDYTPDASWSQVGSKIWREIKKGIKTGGELIKGLVLGNDYEPDASWGQVGKKIWEAIKGAFGTAGELVKELILGEGYEADPSWSAVGKSIWEKIKSGIGAASELVKELVLGENYEPDASWSTVGSAIWEKIKSGIQAVGDWLSSLVTFTPGEGWSTLGGGIWGKIVSGISSAISAAGDWIKNAMDNAGSFVASEGWTDIGGQIINKILEAKASKYANVAAFATDLLTAIVNWSGWSSLAAGFKQIATTIINSIANQVPNLSSMAVKIIEKLGSLLSSDAVKNGIGELGNIAETIINGIASAIPGVTSAATDIVTALGNLLSNLPWEESLTALQGIGTSLMGAITQGIQSATSIGGAAIDSAGGIVESLATAIGNVIAGINWEDYADVASGFGTSVVNMIVTGASHILEQGAKIATAIGDAFAKINWSDMGASAGTIFSNIWDAIVDGAKTLVPDMTNFFDSISRGIAEGGEGLGTAAQTFTSQFLKHILDPENLEAFSQAGLAICKALALGITELGVAILDGAVSVVEGIFLGLMEALGLSGWSEEAQEALSEVTEVVSAAGEELNLTTQEIVTQLQLMNSAVQRGFEWDLESLQDSVTRANLLLSLGNQELIDSIGDFETWGWMAEEKVTSLLATLIDTTASETERAAAALALTSLGYGDMFRNNMTDLDAGTQETIAKVAALFDTITNETISATDRAAALFELIDLGIEPAILENIPSFDGQIESALQSLVDAGIDLTEKGFTELAEVIPESMTTGIENGIPEVEGAAKEIGEIASTANELANIQSNATESGNAADESLKGGIDEKSGDVTSAMETVVDDTGDEADRLKELLKGVSEEAMTNYTTSLENGEAPASAAMDAVGQAVVNAALAQMNADTGYSCGNEYITGLTNGLASGSPHGKMASIAKQIIENARQALSNTIGYSIGLNFAQGLANGILAGAAGVATAAATVAASAAAAAMAKLQIGSPSRLARDKIGAMFDEGLAIGLLDNRSAIVSAANQVTDALRDSFYVGDPSRGTVYTSRESARATATQTAQASGIGGTGSALDRAKEIGAAIADRLISSGALEGDLILNGEVVGRKLAKPVTAEQNRTSNRNTYGRNLQGVLK